MTVRRRVLALQAGCAICISLFGAAQARAVTRFGAEGQGAGEFSEPVGIAIDQESGDVYMVDKNNRRVDRFGAAGEFKLAWGWGVADGSAEPQTCTTACVEGLEGSGAGQLSGFAEGVGVDNDPLSSAHGSVYVFDIGNNRVERFGPEGNFVLAFGHEVNASTHGNICLAGETCAEATRGTGAGEFEPSAGENVAVGPEGDVYVGDLNRVQKFSPAGALLSQITLTGAGGVEALAIDSKANLYVRSGELRGIRKYDSLGTELGTPRDLSGEPGVIAVGPSDELFVLDSSEGKHHVLSYDAAGSQTASFADEGGQQSQGSPSGGIAFGSTIGRLYVMYPNGVFLVSPPPPGPVVLSGSEQATAVLPTTATVNATVNPEGGTAEYHFEYGESEGYGSSTPSTSTTGGEFEDQAIQAPLTGLHPSTTYHFRVVVEGEAGGNPVTRDGPDQTFTTLPPVSIDSESASQVTADSARLAAELNPHGLPTGYRFEYGHTTSYEDAVPASNASAGSGTEDVTIDLLLEGLSPDTTYHYRLVAYNSAATGGVPGPDRTFTTQPEAANALPDGRVWEPVSPADKHGVALEGLTREGGDIQAAENGARLAYIAKAPIGTEPAGNRSFAQSQLLATRASGGGWSTKEITTPHEAVVGLRGGFLSEYRLFSGDLTAGLVEPEGATPLSPAASERTPYLRETNGEYLPLVDPANVPPGTKFGADESTGIRGIGSGVEFVSANPSLRQVVLSAPQSLVEGFATDDEPAMYEWSDAKLTPVSVLPNESTAGLEGGALLGYGGNLVRGAISNDGTRVFFETRAAHHLYMRDLPLSKTLRLDEPTVGALGGNGTAVYQDAAGDGSRAFFLDTAHLTPDATSATNEPDLYMCEVSVPATTPTCALKDLTVAQSPSEPANVQGTMLGAGQDGHIVYFVADGILSNAGVPVAGATHGTCRASQGTLPEAGLSCNLYAEDTLTGTTKFVAALSNRDFPDWEAGSLHDNLGTTTARVSNNGRYLAFMSQRSLTGYDNRDAASGVPAEEVYLYDSDTGHLSCVSCNPTGARPAGVLDPESELLSAPLVDRTRTWKGQWLAASIPGWTRIETKRALYQSRYLTNDGRLFFNSAVGLVPQDANHQQDVYEFEPPGVGSCRTTAATYDPSSDGCTALISSGTSGEESAFLDASEAGPGGEEGEDAFFLTTARLSPADSDPALDVYDAHTCSAAAPCPGPSLSVPSTCSTVDSCRGVPQELPASSSGPPPSATLSGPGNATPAAPAVKRVKTIAQKLAAALKACRKSKHKAKRVACERTARKSYGPGRAKKADGRSPYSKPRGAR